MTNPSDPPADGAGAPPAAAVETPPAGQPPAADSLLSTGAPPAGDDWLPEKYRVNKEDGTLDESASARKLGEAYKHLSTKLGTASALPPAKPEDYAIKPAEGTDEEGFKQFTGDPLFQAFAKDAHAAGLSNDQMQFVVDKYLAIAPQLMKEDAVLSVDDARAELGKLWTDKASMDANLAGVVKAINAYGGKAEDMPGSTARLMAKYGTDPDFIAFAATIAAELPEDRHPSEGIGGAGADIESLQKSQAYWDPNHQDHTRVKARVDQHYARQYGTAAHR